MSDGATSTERVARVPIPAYARLSIDGSTGADTTSAARLAANGRRRRPATGLEAERRKAWGQVWGQAGRDAGIAARQEN